MEFKQYEDFISKACADYTLENMNGDDNISFELLYNAIGMSGEAGEALEEMKKNIRISGVPKLYPMDLSRKDNYLEECGDVLFYMARVAHILGSSLEEIAKINQRKLVRKHDLDDELW